MYITLGRVKLEYWIQFVASEFLKDTKKIGESIKTKQNKKAEEQHASASSFAVNLTDVNLC